MTALWFRSGLPAVNTNVDFARVFGAEVLLRGAPYTRETLARCYYAEKTRTETEEVSEGWISVLWNRIENVPIERWRKAANSRGAFTDFVYEFWGKDI